MVSDVLDIKCSLNGVNVNCSKPSEPGTILTQSCKFENAHNSPRKHGLIKADTELLCLKNAKWSGQLLTTCTSRNYKNIYIDYFNNDLSYNKSNILELNNLDFELVKLFSYTKI